MSKDLKAAYRTIMDDHFPPRMEISFIEDDELGKLDYYITGRTTSVTFVVCRRRAPPFTDS